MKKNKVETKPITIRLQEGKRELIRLQEIKSELNCDIVRVQEYPDIHKIHHREKFPDYMENFQCERDTLYFRKNRAIVVTRRTAGDVIFSGQFRWNDGEPEFTPLVAYCTLQGVKRDVFLRDDCDLSSVEREYRDSLSQVALRTWQLRKMVNVLMDYLENRLPLSPGCVIDNVGRNLDVLSDFYEIFNVMDYKTPQTLESRLSKVKSKTLKSLSLAKMRLTKAGQRWFFWDALALHGDPKTANQEIRVWENDRVTFTSGVTVTLRRDDAKAFLEGGLAELRTSYGQIERSNSLLVCGCHRLCVNHVRTFLGMPKITKEDEQDLPPFLQKLKDQFDDFRNYKIEELGKLQSLWDDGQRDQNLSFEIRTLQDERYQYGYTRKREIREALTQRYEKVIRRLRKKLVHTEEFENAVKASEEKIREQYAQDKIESEAKKRSAECLESLREWIYFLAVDRNRGLLKTS